MADRGVRPTHSNPILEFLASMAARIRALCAFTKVIRGRWRV